MDTLDASVSAVSEDIKLSALQIETQTLSETATHIAPETDTRKSPSTKSGTDKAKICKKTNTKQILGQFYTTNQDYILQGMNIPENIKHIIEPFAGNGDLLKFIKNADENENKHVHKYTLECYDIDPKKDFITKRDTITNPPIYSNKFVLTNPPYLARNKSKDKVLFDKYDVNDLYKCFIKELISNKCLGGIIIIPLNFWSSIRNGDIDLRKSFLEVYKILQLNIFEEQVFNDTTYTTCSFQFSLKDTSQNTSQNTLHDANTLNIMIYPAKTSITTELNSGNNYLIGGDIYNLKTNVNIYNKYKITRATSNNKDKLNTNILVKCIDDNKNSKIGLAFADDKELYIDNTPNLSSRTYATLIITPSIDEDKQKQLVNKFNTYLEAHRKKYNSLFLTNYRESKDIARKRISFDLVYLIVAYILDNFDSILA